MNPFDLSASDLLVWGIVAHLIADWPLQSDWMAKGKALPWRWSISGLAPAFVHAGIHAVALGLVFGYWPGMVLGLTHLLVDTRVPVAWFSKVMRQTPPGPPAFWKPRGMGCEAELGPKVERPAAMLMDLGTTVRFWTDQVWHIALIALAALVI
jgi:hypothetical protein